MVTEYQLNLKAEIHTLAINYFDNAGLALLYDRGLAVQRLDGQLRQVAEELLANKDKYYKELLTQIVARLLTSGKADFDRIIEQSIDPNHGSIKSFEGYGGSFSGWLHQLKTDIINDLAASAVKVRTGEDIEGKKSMVQKSTAEVLGDKKTDPLS